MIVDFFWGLIGGLVSWVVEKLPEIDVEAIGATIATASGNIGAYLGHANSVLPITEMLNILSVVVTLVPAILAYRIFSWIWRHVPIIAGFGTGNG